MAKFGPFKNAFLEINGVDLSDHVESVTLNMSAATLDESAMGDESDIQRAGLFSWSIDANFLQDFAAGSVDAALYPLYVNRTTANIRLRPDAGAISETNPMYSGQAFISSYTPLGGSHGDELMAPVTFSPRNDLVRSTA